MCVAHIFSQLQLCHHPFLINSAQLFSHYHQKIELPIPLKTQHLILKHCPPTKLFAMFVMQSNGGNIKKFDCIALLYVVALCCKVRIMQHKNMLITW
jgi:hypothetical protein